jgi:methylmalonyl-CoA mutase
MWILSADNLKAIRAAGEATETAVDSNSLVRMVAPSGLRARLLDSDFLNLSASLAGGHKTLLPQVVGELKKLGRDDILVVIGGVIPAQDYDYLRERGAAEIFGPGTVIPDAAKRLLVDLAARAKA